MTYVWNTSYIDLIEKIAGIQIVLAADLKLNLFIPGSDLQDFMIDFPWSIFPTFRPIDLVMIWNSSSIWLQTRILILWDLSASSFASSVYPENEDEIWNRSGQIYKYVFLYFEGDTDTLLQVSGQKLKSQVMSAEDRRAAGVWLADKLEVQQSRGRSPWSRPRRCRPHDVYAQSLWIICPRLTWWTPGPRRWRGCSRDEVCWDKLEPEIK